MSNDSIRNTYESMSDEELKRLIQEEGKYLTPAAIILLKDELNKRSLDPGMMITADNKLDVNKHAGFNTQTSGIKAVWKEILNFKEKGKSDHFIIDYFSEQGIEEQDIQSLLQDVEIHTNDLFKKAGENRLTAGFTMLSGFAVTFLPVTFHSHRLVFIIAGCAMAIGALRLIKAVHDRIKYKKILLNVLKERNKDTDLSP